MTDDELRVLHQAAIKLGLPTTEVSVRNPFEMKGKRAEMLQAAISELDPAQAAAWNRDAGGELSLACQMAERGLIEHNSSTKKELWEKSPAYVLQRQAAQKKAEEELLAKWEKEAGDARERRTGSREIDETPYFGTGWQAQSRRKQWEYEQSMRTDR